MYPSSILWLLEFIGGVQGTFNCMLNGEGRQAAEEAPNQQLIYHPILVMKKII
jgi:hypothetical protein